MTVFLLLSMLMCFIMSEDIEFRKDLVNVVDVLDIEDISDFELELEGYPYITLNSIYYIRKLKNCEENCLVLFRDDIAVPNNEVEANLPHFHRLCAFRGPIEENFYYISIVTNATANKCKLYRLDDEEIEFTEIEEYYYINSYPVAVNNTLIFHLEDASNPEVRFLTWLTSDSVKKVLLNDLRNETLVFDWISFPILSHGEVKNYHYQEPLRYRHDNTFETTKKVHIVSKLSNTEDEDDKDKLSGFYEMTYGLNEAFSLEYLHPFPDETSTAMNIDYETDDIFILPYPDPGQNTGMAKVHILLYEHSSDSLKIVVVNDGIKNEKELEDVVPYPVNFVAKRLFEEEGKASISIGIGIESHIHSDDKFHGLVFCDQKNCEVLPHELTSFFVQPRDSKVFSTTQFWGSFVEQNGEGTEDIEMIVQQLNASGEVTTLYGASEAVHPLGTYLQKILISSHVFGEYTSSMPEIFQYQTVKTKLLEHTTPKEEIHSLLYFFPSRTSNFPGSYDDPYYLGLVQNTTYKVVKLFMLGTEDGCIPKCNVDKTERCNSGICECKEHVSNEGEVVPGTCDGNCEDGWFGKNCSVFCEVGDSCSHGTCQPDGSCQCSEFWDGDQCDNCVAGRDLADDCKTCFAHSIANPKSVKKECVELKCGGVFFDEVNKTKLCSGHGECKLNLTKIGEEEKGSCECEEGFFSEMCDLFKCFGELSDSSGACSGHGECKLNLTKIGEEEKGSCECEEGFFSEMCDLFKCYGELSDVAGACSGHGECVAPDSCKCSSEYEDDKCDKLKSDDHHDDGDDKKEPPKDDDDLLSKIYAAPGYFYTLLIFCCCCPLLILIAAGIYTIFIKHRLRRRDGNLEARGNIDFHRILPQEDELQNQTFVELNSEEEKTDSLNLEGLDGEIDGKFTLAGDDEEDDNVFY